jgi:TrmH family RNA methyltransferase
MERITSRQNAIVKRFRALARASGTTATPDVLLDGAHLVQEALATALPIEIAACAERHLADPRSPIAQLARDLESRGARVLAVPDQVLAAISPVDHPTGIVAIAHAQSSTVAAAFSATLGSDPKPPLVLILAGLQDPGNVGASVRTAAAGGATAVIAVDGSANPFGWKALRGAMGGTFHLPVAARGTLDDVVREARATKVRLIAAVPRGGTALPRVDFRGPVAIVLGAEGSGVAEPLTAAAAELVSIPMRRGVESLNVAVAAALILYEASRQRDAES